MTFRSLIALAAASLALLASAAYAQVAPISGLPAATTPLTGAELVPCVQGGVVSRCAASGLGSGMAACSPSSTCSVSGAWSFSNAILTGGSINGTPIGQTTPAAVSATTLSASGAVSGAGFSNYLASPPAIGGTTPNAVSATTLTASGAVTLSGITGSAQCLQVNSSGVVSGAGASCVSAAAGPGRLIGVQVFTANGTYTPDSGTNSIVVDGVGGGGAGGGVQATSSSQGGISGAGSAGTYARARYTSGFSGLTVTIGSAGVGASGAAGGNGGTTSFGALLTIPGGLGAGAANLFTGSGVSSSAGSSASSPSGSGIIYQSLGAPAHTAFQLAPASGLIPPAPQSMLGSAYGSGGAGAFAGPSSSAVTGNSGKPGVLIIYEYS